MLTLTPDGPFVLGEEPRDHEVVVVGGRGVDLLQEAPVPCEVLGGSANELRGGAVRERRLAKFRQNVARFQLYRHRFLQENMRFAAFFKIYQIIKLNFLIWQNFASFATFAKCLLNFHKNW